MLDPDYNDFDFLYLSLGAGVQSTALYLMCSTEDRAPRAAAAIFADTHDEPPWVYENIDRLREWAATNDGIPIHVVTIGCLSDHIMNRAGNAAGERFASVPAFTLGADGAAAPLRRQCTREYKIRPIEKKVRELMGYKPRQVIKKSACALIGISFDEIHRLRTNSTRWVENAYPLVDARIGRLGCLEAISSYGLPEPRKSSCVYCPYHSDRFWRDLRDNHPEMWEQSTRFDEGIRDMSRAGVDGDVFLHRSLVPLKLVDLNETGDLFDMEHGACDGYCDT